MRFPRLKPLLLLACAGCIAAAPAARADTAPVQLAGIWNGANLDSRSNCTSTANNGQHGTYAQYVIGVSGGFIEIAQTGVTGLQCNYKGTYSEAGADRQASGTFSCSDGKQGTFLVTNFLVTENEMSLKLSEQLTGSETCAITAIIGGSRFYSAVPPPSPSIDYTGGWYAPAESGWGVSIVKGTSSVLGVIIYTYDANHAPAWFILQNGSWQNPTTFSGTLFRFTGPAFAEPFNATPVANAAVGSATLTFTSATVAQIDYVIAGTSKSRPLAKLSF